MWIVWLCVLAAGSSRADRADIPFGCHLNLNMQRVRRGRNQRFQIRICGIRLIRGKGQEDKTGKAAQAEEKKAHKPQESDEEKNGKNDEFGFSQFMERIDGVNIYISWLSRISKTYLRI